MMMMSASSGNPFNNKDSGVVNVQVCSSCGMYHVDPTLLRRALRLVHCLQKERGASCAYYASRHDKNIVDNMNRSRKDSDRAIQMMLSGKGEFKVHTTLMKIRKMVEQVDLLPSSTTTGKNTTRTGSSSSSSCHRVLVCFNALISSIVHDYFMEKIAKQEKSIQIHRQGTKRGSLKEKAHFATKNSPLVFNSRKLSSTSKHKGHGRAKSMGDCLLFSEESDYYMDHVVYNINNNNNNMAGGTTTTTSNNNNNAGGGGIGGIGGALNAAAAAPPPPPPTPLRAPISMAGSAPHSTTTTTTTTTTTMNTTDPTRRLSPNINNLPTSQPPETLGSGPPLDSLYPASGSGGGIGGPPPPPPLLLPPLHQHQQHQQQGGGASASSPRHHKRSSSESSPHNYHVHFDLHDEDQAEEVLVRLLNILACFVKLKESTGVERAVLSSLVVSGKEDSLLLSDLVLEVENQRRLLDELKSLPFGSLRNLVQELVEMSTPLRELQQKILTNFDLEGVIIKDPEYFDVTAVWDLITVYIDKLHSLELLIIEEIEYCLPSLEMSGHDHHDRVHHARGALLGSEFIAGLFGSASSEEDVKMRLEKMSPEEIKQKLLEGLVPGTITATTPRNGEHSNKSSISNGSTHHSSNRSNNHALSHSVTSNANNIVDDPLLLIPNLPASKEWEINLYELKFLKRIGEGAAGTTYLAKWTGLEVAVKVASITEHGLEGWRTEVQALQKLHHPNIIRLLGSVYHPNPLTFCLVLEYCNAGDLADALKYPTAPSFFFHAAISIAKGVAYLHSRGVMHRDIKPDNILIDGNVKSGQFTMKVSDFGVATETSILGDRTAETGTYRWMAPEVLRHESYSNMADVYSYAVVLWQLLTRESPYATISQIEAAGKVALEFHRPPFPSGTPKGISDIIETCWSEDPDDRLPFDQICERLPEREVGLGLSDRKWLDAPLGHPVYFPREPTLATEDHKPPRNLSPMNRKKDGEKKKSGFFRIKMFGH